MDVEKLIERLFEETNLEDEGLLIMAYGSRVNNTANKHSDLDILIISGNKGSYRQAILIDGIPIDITIMSIENAQDNIINSKVTGSSYFEAILKYGQVIVDKIGLYDDLKELLKHRINRPRHVDGTLCSRAMDHYHAFLTEEENSNVNYFSALELIRRIYHAQNNLSNIQSSKVYDLYIRPNLAHSSYALTLPDSRFIDIYLSAMQTLSREVQKIWLQILYEEVSDLKPKESYPILDKNQRDLALINLNNAIWRCEDMILAHHPGATALYYSLIGEIKNLYYMLFGDDLKVEISSEVCTSQQMIDNLEYLFSLVDVNHEIDYNDYIIRVK